MRIPVLRIGANAGAGVHELWKQGSDLGKVQAGKKLVFFSDTITTCALTFSLSLYHPLNSHKAC